MTSVRNDKCSDKDFVIQIFRKKIFFAPITFQVFLKHLPNHENHRDQIGFEKSVHTYKHTHEHPQIIVWMI